MSTSSDEDKAIDNIRAEFARQASRVNPAFVHYVDSSVYDLLEREGYDMTNYRRIGLTPL